ncbi:MAG: isochorismate synthase MenF [Actinomycetes bacterium]
MSVAPTPAPAAALVARTVRLDVAGDLLSYLPGPATERPLAWVHRGEGLVAWGEAVRVEVSGPGRFADAQAAWQQVAATAVVRDDVRLPGTGPVALVSFSFADDSPAGGVLVVPRVVVGRRGSTTWVTTISSQGSLPPAGAPQPTEPPRPPGLVRFADGARSGPQWTAVVRRAVDRIAGGELDKVVLARDLEAQADDPVDPRWVLGRLAERYPSCWTFAVDGLVGATPEMLVRVERGLVTSRVLAGTIRRTGDDAHDLALAGSLARSSKDLEEHEYAVRSVVEALSPHCSSTSAPESPFVLHLPNVMHLATDVAGVLADGHRSVLQLGAALHPTAAVCGTPTPAAARVIAELEGMDRDRYAGPVGWVDAAGDGELGIALRCGRLDAADPTRLRLFAGCGVVAGSDPEAELAESDAKLVPMRDAVSGA